MLIILIVLVVIVALGIIFLQRSGGFGFPWVEFYVKGKESGFSFPEINLMRKAAVQNKLKNPSSLFWSERTLDRCIRGIIVQQRSKGDEDSQESIEFISKLFEFRNRVEFNRPKYRQGITSSRKMVAGQYLKLLLPGSGVYVAKVVENLRRYLAISYPEGKALPPGFSWKGQRIKVYFWRKEDAGYYFETLVLGDYNDQKFPILHIRHSDTLTRTQRRQSIRIDVNRNGQLHRLRTLDVANEQVGESGGYRCRIVDISESGAAVMVGGKAKAGMAVKIQTVLDDQDVVMCGAVKDVTYQDRKNASILHIEAASVGPVMKNRILSHVYGIFRDQN